MVGSDSSTSQPPPEPMVMGASAIAIVSPRSGPFTTTNRPRPDCRVIVAPVEDARGCLLDHFLCGDGATSGAGVLRARRFGFFPPRRRRRLQRGHRVVGHLLAQPAPPAAPAISVTSTTKPGGPERRTTTRRRVASEVDGLGEAAPEAAAVVEMRARGGAGRHVQAGGGSWDRDSRRGAGARGGRAAGRRNSAPARGGMPPNGCGRRRRRERRRGPDRRRCRGELGLAVVAESRSGPGVAGNSSNGDSGGSGGGGMKLLKRAAGARRRRR